MFYSRKQQTVNFEEALRWVRNGLPVSIKGWVKVYRAGQEKELEGVSFEELMRYHPKWRVTTENIFVDSRVPWYQNYSSSNDYRNRKELREVAFNRTSNLLSEFEVELDVRREVLPPRKRRRLEKIGKIKKSRCKQEINFSEEVCREKLSLMWQRFESEKRKWEIAGKVIDTVRLCHGTKAKNFESIFEAGFRLSQHRGMLGRGIYVGPYRKARNYSDGIILICEVLLGRCKELENVELLENNPGYDSMHLRAGNHSGVKGGRLRNEEWVIRHPVQVRVVGINLKG